MIQLVSRVILETASLLYCINKQQLSAATKDSKPNFVLCIIEGFLVCYIAANRKFELFELLYSVQQFGIQVKLKIKKNFYAKNLCLVSRTMMAVN